MLLIIRFFFTMLLSRVRRRIGPLDESTVRFTVLPNDCDLNFHLNDGRFVSFIGLARVELLGRMKLLSAVLARGWRPINGGILVRYRRSILPMQRFAIRSRVVGWDEKWIYFEHIVERNGELCAIANARGVLRGREGNVPPRELLALAGMPGLPSPPLPEMVERWRALEDAR